MNKALIFFLAFFGLINISLLSQNDSKVSTQKHLYARPFYAGVGLSYPLGFMATLGSYNRNGFGGAISINGLRKLAKNIPSDYEGGFGGHKVFDNTMLLSLRATIDAFTDHSDNSNFGLELGPSYIRTWSPVNYKPNVRSGWFEPSHTYDRVASNSFGLSFKVKLGAVMGDMIGVHFGLFALLSNSLNYCGVDLMCTIGGLKEKSKAK